MTTDKRISFIFQRGKSSVELQFAYLTDIFEDINKIVRDRFVGQSVNVMKNGPRCKETQADFNIHQFGSATSIEIFTRNKNTQNFRKPYWFVKNC